MALVGDYKYNSEIASSKPIAKLLSSRINDLDLDGEIVPIPTIPAHIRQRGFDHIVMMARQLSRETGLAVNNKMLIRVDNSSQHTLSGSERKTHIKKSLKLSEKYQHVVGSDNHENQLPVPHTAIILDDIWTTGATMETAAKLLRSIGVQKIIGLVVLYQPK